VSFKKKIKLVTSVHRDTTNTILHTKEGSGQLCDLIQTSFYGIWEVQNTTLQQFLYLGAAENRRLLYDIAASEEILPDVTSWLVREKVVILQDITPMQLVLQ
jgi:hypothetical protein